MRLSIQDLGQQKIAIMGMGRSGVSALKLCLHYGAQVWAINRGPTQDWGKSLENEGVELVSQEQVDNSLAAQIDLLVLSPGISRQNPQVQIFISQGVSVISEIQLGSLALDKESVLAVTGTNGKTTTATLLGEVLRDQGVTTFVGGNIGTPLCDYALNKAMGAPTVSAIVLELSSFQLESTQELKLCAGCILNISPNHGERYENLLDYARAKWQLAKLCEHNKAPLAIGQSVVDILGENTSTETLVLNSDDAIKLGVPGPHNRENASFALWLLDKFLDANSIEIDRKLLTKSLQSFRGVEHRLERVFLDGEKRILLNDAKSTNWQAMTVAVNAASEFCGDLYLIVGGKLRGRNDGISPFATLLEQKVKHLFLIGESANSLGRELDELETRAMSFSKHENLQAAISEFYRMSSRDSDILLFSPGHPSFDQYTDYQERGKNFKDLLLSTFRA